MSKFDKFMKTIGNAAEKAVNEGAKLTDLTATKVKIKAEQARLCERYEELGRVAEQLLRSRDEKPEQIALALDAIDRVNEKISLLEAELAQKKARHQENDEENEGAN